jgi:hypothetical protein
MEKSFEVTRGVAQGCVISHLFFNIYLDDLLTRFRDGLGVPVGCTLLNAFSFADDLALIAQNKQTVFKFSNSGAKKTFSVSTQINPES